MIRRKTFRVSLAGLVVLCFALQACAFGAGSTQSATGKIGFVFVGSHDDLGYNQAAWEGSSALARAVPDYFILRTENVPETKAAEDAMEALVRRGARIIFATSYGYLPFAYKIAKRHPDVIVLHQGGVEPKPNLSNFGTYWGAVYEPVYLAGMAAGAATKTGKLGYVVAFPIPATFDNVDAFTLGARSVRSSAVTRVIFTGSWCDPVKQADAAARMLAWGADVLTQHQDCTTTILKAAERSGVDSVGYHYDGSDIAPNGWLAGSVWDWGNLYIDIVRTIVAGKFVRSQYEGDFVGGLGESDNPFVLTELGRRVTPRARALIARARERFASGGSPFAGPIFDRDNRERVPAGVIPSYAAILQMDYFVNGVLGAIPKS